MNRDYAEARLIDDSRNACADYGLDRGTQRYDNCVAREIDARRYREQSQMSVPQTFVPDYAPAPAPYAYVAPRATGVAATRDEYGFRYDAYGNRVDRYGHVISPQARRGRPRPGRLGRAGRRMEMINVARNNPAHRSRHRPAGRFQTSGSYGYGYGHRSMGVLGTVVVIVLILVLLGRF